MNPTSSELPTKVRSVLYGNVDILLERISATRNSRTSEDSLFGESESSTSLQLNLNVPTLTDLEILMNEKNSLGLYVSGAPLVKYKELLDWVREVSSNENVHLLLIDKVRKIFTRSNTMMLALTITSADDVNYEGIVFPKAAPKVSPLVAEKQLFWIRGRIVTSRRKKAEKTPEDEESSFEELPKIAIEDAAPFREGPLKLFLNDEIKLPMNRQKLLQIPDWNTLYTSPELLDSMLNGESNTEASKEKPIQAVRISSLITPDTLRRIKSMLVTTPHVDMDRVELYIEKNGEYKKAKGIFYTNLDKLSALLTP